MPWPTRRSCASCPGVARRDRVIVPDLNLLLYAVNADMPQHSAAHRWWLQCLNGDEPIGMPWTVALGFLRLSTNARIFGAPLTANAAIQLLDEWLARPMVQWIDPLGEHWRIVCALLEEAGAAGNLTSDAHLAALCIERGATLHSADADFGRFRNLRWENPLIG